MEMGAGSPEQFASIFRVDNAALSHREKSFVIASCHAGLEFEGASANLRRLSGSRGSGGGQDTFLAEEAGGPHVSDEDFGGVQEGEKTGDREEENGGPAEEGRGQG